MPIAKLILDLFSFGVFLYLVLVLQGIVKPKKMIAIMVNPTLYVKFFIYFFAVLNGVILIKGLMAFRF